jgi:hypothetical protein
MTTLVRNKLGAAILMATKSVQLKSGKPANGSGLRDLRHAAVSARAPVSHRLALTRLFAPGIAGAMLCSILCIPIAAADGNAPAKKTDAAPANDGRTDWGGLNWGIGVATNFIFGGARNTSATIVNDSQTNTNIVRVTDGSSNVDVSFVLEAHYFLRDFLIPAMGYGTCPGKSPPAPYFFNCTEVAHGPFAALEIGGGTTAPNSTTAGLGV